MNQSFFTVPLRRFYYQVDGQKTGSKIRALELACGNLSRIHWYFMDHAWDSVDWEVEPNRSWSQLLTERCHQLRQKYQHLALWYSGGYDSHTILTAFLYAGICLDELIIQDRRHLVEDNEFQTAVSTAHWIKTNHWPNLKINPVAIDVGANLDFYQIYGDQWIYDPDSRAQFAKWNPYLRSIGTYHLKDVPDVSGRGEIAGFDKPKVMLSDGKWYMFCPDSISHDLVGSRTENFYWDESMPEIHVKQCRMVIRWFESLPDLSEDLVHVIQGRDITDARYALYFPLWNKAIGRAEIVNKLAASMHGQQKHTNLGRYQNNARSHRLWTHAQASQHASVKIYLDGVTEIERIQAMYGSNTNVMSRRWYIKDLESVIGIPKNDNPFGLA